LFRSENDVLDHDSYIELQPVRFTRDEIHDATIGLLTLKVAAQIIAAAEADPTLTEEIRDVIREGLNAKAR